MADNLTTFICRLSLNLGASTFWIPQGQSRPVMGLLFIVLRYYTFGDTVFIRLCRTHVAYTSCTNAVI